MSTLEDRRRWAREYYHRNKETILPTLREKYKTDGEFREKTRQRSTSSNLKQYGLSTVDYEKLFANQNGRCLICGQSEHSTRMAVDHDHVTGKVRGLLCRLCNASLGGFRDNIALLKKAIAYLEANS